MSLTEDGRDIHCDGQGCTATTHSPVALRPVLARPLERAGRDCTGWLCVSSRGRGHHFCPVCSARYLALLFEGEGLAGESLAPEAHHSTW